MNAAVRRRGAGSALSVLLGVLIALFGLIFIVGGADLAWLGGSWYYLICGVVLLASGALIVAGRVAGAWLFLLAWAATLLWTMWETSADTDWWGWLPRLFGPTLIAIAVLLVMPALRRRDTVRPLGAA
ncbi:glucose dehydrogenase [Endobacter medicaginis]|uniref:Glucose dehydrogenase n=1 Tax=Endobacter medicaginis TaxID=1181271 RepID=A0A839UYR4_9PROT|nr:glycerol dehydrogenase [Endobacter medicaginis]MBB3173280.1 glucose dehydrogenase [Endobacter medicaginis]MCX5475759.1 glycerol dehydrogenase [Endobacter medicaginis]NVN29940.1 glycerol dehydrogenase [Endobacter medicaginis]